MSVKVETLILFGATGDLAQRMLFPSLYNLHVDGLLADVLTIIASGRSRMDRAACHDMVRKALDDHLPADRLDEEQIAGFLDRVDYCPVDAGAGTGYDDLAALLGDRMGRPIGAYLSTPPSMFGPIAQGLKAAGIACAECRIAMEKPIGHDLASSREVNAQVGDAFAEDHVFRIDHYLGKETVQNLLALRFANILFEPLWNASRIDHVQITVAETVGLEKRAGYYDTSGALRDMVQNHLLQLLCMVAMEPPAALQADAVRDEKLKVLRSLKPIRGEDVSHLSVRGQYRAGASSGAAVPGYLDELGKPDSRTETFVALKAEVDNWRWAGVPFYLRTGKRLAERVSEIVIAFKQIPHSIFDDSAGPVMGNKLVLRLQPDEGVKLWIMIKDPGPGGLRLQHVPLDMSFAEAFGVHQPEAYERLLMDVVRGNQTLFMRRDEVEAAWAWIDPILSAWEAGRETPKPYTAGSWGPSAAVALVERDGRTWHEDTV